MLKYRTFKTRFGWCGIIFNRDGDVKKIVLPDRNRKLVLSRLGSKNAFLADCTDINLIRLIKEYFKGKKVKFRVKPDLSGFSRFERKVYLSLQRIPYGRVITYSDLARRAEVPGAARAVGNAVAKNPLPIIIPCHRVVRKSGALGGFSAISGAKLKEKLLQLEKAR
ncbi:MAG: methylated-DNA--[protein]-cysteine S-methyltransferase [Planctomycetota bacterium]